MLIPKTVFGFLYMVVCDVLIQVKLIPMTGTKTCLVSLIVCRFQNVNTEKMYTTTTSV
jgi:hypothetical protein